MAQVIMAQLMGHGLPAFFIRIALVDIDIRVPFRIFPEDAMNAVREQNFTDNDFAMVPHYTTSMFASYRSG
jgi:hypothetical protein